VRRLIALRRIYAQALRFEEDRLVRRKPPPAEPSAADLPDTETPAASSSPAPDPVEETRAHAQA
jgi:hypothetical protein